jgi:hypothetical protein
MSRKTAEVRRQGSDMCRQVFDRRAGLSRFQSAMKKGHAWEGSGLNSPAGTHDLSLAAAVRYGHLGEKDGGA